MSKFVRFRKIAALCIMFSLTILSYKMVFALDSTSISVNGTSIYTTAGGYNAGHGVAGVTFDVGSKVLTLTNATLENISADDDLTINLVGTNTITSSSPDPTIRSIAGNITFIGNEASLTISAFGDDNTAIRIGADKRLTIGNTGSLNDVVTVTIARGVNMNTQDTYIVGDNVYNYEGAPDPGDPMGPPPGDPLQIYVDGFVAIDETADPRVTSVSGEGWSIEQGFMGIYELSIDTGITLPYITGSGDGALSINPEGGDITIAENEDRRSINMDGRVEILTRMDDAPGDINLIGGIYTEGSVNVNDRDMTIGSSGTPSITGIEADSVYVGSGNLSIYTTSVALQYYNPAPAPGEGMDVESGAGKSLTVETSDTATANVSTVRVSGGGTVDLSYTTALGDFTPEASHWPWTEMSGTEEENPQPTTVTCSEGTDATNKYRLTTGDNNFLLESTAGTLFQLGWNIPDADDSIVTNGTVRVIAANGYGFTSDDYSDFSIEEGSTVTIELLPDYGYQYVSGGLNGNQTMPDEGKASYTFTMPSNHLHLSAIFERSDDIISISSSKVASASIAVPDGALNGNAEFTVADNAGGDTTAFRSAASGSTIGGLVDLTLNEVILKGTTDEAWKTSISELDQEMSVNLALADNLKGHTNYSILRDHDGTVTKLDTTYNAATGTLSFATDAYSTYAIAYSDTPTNPNTYDGVLLYLIIGVVSLAGLLAVLFYLKKSKLKFK